MTNPKDQDVNDLAFESPYVEAKFLAFLGKISATRRDVFTREGIMFMRAAYISGWYDAAEEIWGDDTE